MSTSGQSLPVVMAVLAVCGAAWLGWSRHLPPTLAPVDFEVPERPVLPAPPVTEAPKPASKKGEGSARDEVRRAIMQLDRNQDGKVAIGEYSPDGRWATRFLERDKDGDGFLTNEELKQGAEAKDAKEGKAGKGGKEGKASKNPLARWKDFPIAAADANADGSLDESEFPGPPEIFLVLDRDGNKAVSTDEIERLSSQ